MDKAFVGRRPIYRDGVEVFGYELFNRKDELSHPAFTNGDAERAEALLKEFIDVGLERVVGPHPAFVDVTRDFILSDYCSAVPKHNVVLQVAADAPADDVLLGALSRLSHAGYSIALDNFVYREDV